MREVVSAACIQIESLTGKENPRVKERFPRGNSDVMMITYLQEEEKREASEDTSGAASRTY